MLGPSQVRAWDIHFLEILLGAIDQKAVHGEQRDRVLMPFLILPGFRAHGEAQFLIIRKGSLHRTDLDEGIFLYERELSHSAKKQHPADALPLPVRMNESIHKGHEVQMMHRVTTAGDDATLVLHHKVVLRTLVQILFEFRQRITRETIWGIQTAEFQTVLKIA